MSEVHICRKCGKPHSSKEYEESRFCGNCGTFLINEKRTRSTSRGGPTHAEMITEVIEELKEPFTTQQIVNAVLEKFSVVRSINPDSLRTDVAGCCVNLRSRNSLPSLPLLLVSVGQGLYRRWDPQKDKDSAFGTARAEEKVIGEISLNVKEFRKIIREYYTKPRPDPFLDWFKEQEKAGVFQSLFEKVLVVIIDARFDQATKAEKALENTKRVFEAGLIRKEPAKLNEVPSLIPVADTTSEKWTESFFLAHRMLINYAEDIIKCRRWTAEKLVEKLQNVPYLGPKTSRLCVRWLHELIRDLEVDMSSYKVPVDRLLYRVACRLGIVNPYREKYWVGYEGGPADEKIQDFARNAFPENPGLIDEPMWSEGRMPQDGGHCYPKNPIHFGCLFEGVCPKKYDGVDPSRIGMVDSSRFRRFG